MSFKLTPSPGSTKDRKRIGRGNASGQGRTAVFALGTSLIYSSLTASYTNNTERKNNE